MRDLNKKFSFLVLICLGLLIFVFPGISYAQDDNNASDDRIMNEFVEQDNSITGTILPSTSLSVEQCQRLFDLLPPSRLRFLAQERINTSTILGCGIKTGEINLWMVPYYIRYILEFVIGLAGLVAVGGVLYGGFLYLFAGISDDKDRGKKAILYGVVGFVLTLVAWAFVNIVISLVTSI